MIFVKNAGLGEDNKLFFQCKLFGNFGWVSLKIGRSQRSRILPFVRKILLFTYGSMKTVENKV